MLLLELEISGWPYREHMKTAKMVDFVSDCLVKKTLRLFESLSVVLTMVPTLLRQFRRSLQTKKSFGKALRVL